MEKGQGMEYSIFDTYDEISRHAADIVIGQLRANGSLLLGAATGSTPQGLYVRLADEARRDSSAFRALRLMKLDEWLGLPMDDPGTCEYYLRTRLVQPLTIAEDRYFSFDSDPKEPEAECRRMSQLLDRNGPIDVCILGLGVNGHIAFNEPGSALMPRAHVARLAKTSQSHSMMADHASKPEFGLTLGIADIFRSRMILLLVSGVNKREIVKYLLTQNISSDVPASLLWLHPNAICLLDRDAVG
jgi:galactosamine-6-phosphate isomerase